MTDAAVDPDTPLDEPPPPGEDPFEIPVEAGDTVPLPVLEAWLKVMQAVQSIGKTGRVEPKEGEKGPRYSFRGVDAVVDAVGPQLRRYGVVVTPIAVDHRQTALQRGFNVVVKVEYHLRSIYKPQGPDDVTETVIVGSAWGEASDYGDKATPKAMSVAWRTFLTEALAIPTGDVDPDAQVYDEDRRPAAASAPRQSGRGQRSSRSKPASNAGPPSDKVAPNQADQIKKAIAEFEDPAVVEAFKTEFGVTRASQVLRSDYSKAMKWLAARKSGAPQSDESSPPDASEPSAGTEGADEGAQEPPADAHEAAIAYVDTRTARQITAALAHAGLPTGGGAPEKFDRLVTHYTDHGLPPSAR